ncbi:hypothetical protein ACIHDR_47790 [Nocardia sp. NPDC052278]|uniref:hypothetical protein n=1 Tax=unclassified Nocardia TaxID=2637762 RepID=UPI0036ACD660
MFCRKTNHQPRASFKIIRGTGRDPQSIKLKLVVREAADARPYTVGDLVLVEGWAGPDGASMFSLAPDVFVKTIREAAEGRGDGRWIPAPPPAAFGISDTNDVEWLAARLSPQPLRAFTESTRLSGAVDQIPGTAIYCRPQIFPFEHFGKGLGYQIHGLDSPHDVMLTRPEALAQMLLDIASFKIGKDEV